MITRQVIQDDKYNMTHIPLEHKVCRLLLAYPHGLMLSQTQCCSVSPSQLIYLIKLTVKTFNFKLRNSGVLREEKKRKIRLKAEYKEEGKRK